jgi:mRNA-degrading endonuclease toxin of MazEF toxin-antitoxin module
MLVAPFEVRLHPTRASTDGVAFRDTIRHLFTKQLSELSPNVYTKLRTALSFYA